MKRRAAPFALLILLGCEDVPEGPPQVEPIATATAMWRQDNVIVITGTLEVKVDTASPASIRVTDAVMSKRDPEPDIGLQLSTAIDATRHLVAEQQHVTLSFPFVATGTPTYGRLNALSCPEQISLDLTFQLQVDSEADLRQQTVVMPLTCAACPAPLGEPIELERMELDLAWSTPLFGASFSVSHVAVAADGAVWLTSLSLGQIIVTRVQERRTSATSVIGDTSNLVLGDELAYVGTSASDRNRIVAVTPEGDELWTIRLPASFAAPLLALSDGRLFVGHYGESEGMIEDVVLAERTPYLLVFDAQTGVLETALPWSPISSMARTTDGSVLIGNSEGITALDQELSVRQVAALNAAGQLTVDETTGAIYVIGEDATVTKLDADGVGQWHRSGLVRAPLALAPLSDGSVLVGLESGALRLDEDGEFVGPGTDSLVDRLPFCGLEERIHVASGGGHTVYSAEQFDFQHPPKLSAGLIAPIDP